MNKDQAINGIRIGEQTLAGHIGAFPREDGNRFTIFISEKESYRIVNFHAENLRELLKRKVVEWPIKIIPISKDEAIICDERIPDGWYHPEQGFPCWPVNSFAASQKPSMNRRLSNVFGDATLKQKGNEERVCIICGKIHPVFQYSIKIQRYGKLVKEICICEDCIDAKPDRWATLLALSIHKHIHPY